MSIKKVIATASIVVFILGGCGGNKTDYNKELAKAVKGAYGSSSYEDFYNNKEKAKGILSDEVLEQLYTVNNKDMPFADLVKVDVSKSNAENNSMGTDYYIARVKIVNVAGEYEMVLGFSKVEDGVFTSFTSSVKSAYNKLTDSTEK